MRKLGIVLAALACLAFVAFPAHSAGGAAGKMSFGVTGGLTMPSGKLGEKFDPTVDLDTNEGIGADMKMGMDFGFNFEYGVTKDIAVGADFSYSTMTMDDQTILGTTYSELLKAKTMQFGVHGKYFVPTQGPIVPYLSLGVGMYNRKLEASKDFQDGAGINEESISDTKPGGFAGVGVEYKVTPLFGIGVDGAYHMAAGKLEHDFGGGTDETVLKDWTYMTFNVGVKYHIPMAGK